MTGLGIVLLGIIAVAFRGSWTAHRDAALASHFDATGAALYPFAPDGLIVIALIAAMVLRHTRKARLYALFVVGLFTFTSFVINHLHGLGQFTRNPVSGAVPDLPWPVVALIAGQVIGAIFFGSHLIVFALRHLFPGTHADQPEHGNESTPEPIRVEEPVRVVETVLDPDPEEIAKKVYSVLLDLDQAVGRDKLARVCGISPRAAVRVRKAVEQDREEAELRREEEARLEAERKEREAKLAEAQRYAASVAAALVHGQESVSETPEAEPTDEELTAGLTPAEVLGGPPMSVRRRQWREQRDAEQVSPNGSAPRSTP
ncbi:DUF2637 domain-containing protein [Nonomuraea sp. NPDC003560]|uniref:DUF2637 domain-containing protein n=1 Tax=Nonomuraea sp. NPDC003560 TaxID=3364341 RepID=UPI003682CD41